ncbi:serine-rich adhesin for platelets isoform X2 [Ochlerotatus camptorhynchus]|uniref:serine-rich adhesin for platelets isoform X2 n=1 Tax=Ochlerotatus camptorhynchus TaxID=644619 RepID=UPI0031E12E82
MDVTESDEIPLSISPPPPPPPSTSTSDHNLKKMGIPDTQSDFNQWLHAMKMVARLPGGMPPEFRRKLWLALSDRYLQSKGINWNEEGEKYLTDQWDEDDEELGIQIVKDLHRTGSSLCSGPSGTINQAKLKRVLLGYSRFNPEVGYCQGFNMLGALILQVMDKNEADSIKVMILLIEGLLPPGYFCGSLGGLQADMAVFRDLLGTRLPKLARHLQKLQGPEGAFEPPLTNVFTMQWFLTLFCTCLPSNSVLRIWDLILIEGSDVLLRTALAIWGLLEGRIIVTKTADDFYCKMGALSTELVNGNLIDCNGLIQRIVDIGPIQDLHKLREKHVHNISQLKDSSNLRIFYSDDEGESDEDSRLAVTATAWGLRSGRRASLGIPTNLKGPNEGREKINLDISLLKKQYDKLRERQRQAHIILSAAVARQPTSGPQNSNSLQVNQLLVGKSAILSNKGKRLGPPQGAVPPLRPQKASKSSKSGAPKSPKPTETLHWKDMDEKQRRGSLKWKDTKKENKKPVAKDDLEVVKPDSPKLKKSSSASSAISNLSETGSSSVGAKRRSESSSYSEESDADSSTSTSLCDDDNQLLSASSLEASPMKRRLTPDSIKEVPGEDQLVVTSEDAHYTEFPALVDIPRIEATLPDIAEESHSETQSSSTETKPTISTLDSQIIELSERPEKARTKPLELALSTQRDTSFLIAITSTSQLSPIPDITHYVSMSTISPLRTPSSMMDYSDYLNNIPSENTITVDAVVTDSKDKESFNVDEKGVTNQLFERINAAERPNKLDLNVIKERKVSESLVNTTESVLDHSDATSKLDNYSFTNVSNRSSMSSSFVLELPVRSSLQQDSPLLPPNTNLSIIPSEKSPVIHKTHIYQIADTIAPSPKESPEEMDKYLANRVKFLKEKSFSMDDPIKGDDLYLEDISKRSASEGLVSVDINAYKSNKMSEIIKENSLILGRIIRKNNQVDDSHTAETSKQEEQFVQSDEKSSSPQYNDEIIDLNLAQEVNELLEKIHAKSLPEITTPVNTEVVKLIPKIDKVESPSHLITFSTNILSSEVIQTASTVDESSHEKVSISPLRTDTEQQNSTKPKSVSSSNECLIDESPNSLGISKTDLVIKRTEEQLARFKDPEPTYYVRKDNFREIITPEEEKNIPVTSKPEETPKNSVDQVSDKSSKKTVEPKLQAIETKKTINADVKERSKSPDESRKSTAFTVVDTQSATPSKTDALIKKTEEQLARFRTDRNVLEKLEKRLSLIDFKVDEAPSTVMLDRKPSNKTEEIIKKSEEQISRIKIETPFIAKKSPTRLVLEDSVTPEAKSTICSSKTEEIIKKTDEQLARFKAAAESNAEKRKSRHEIDELLQPKLESPDISSHSSDSIKFDDISVRDHDEAKIIKHAQAEILKTIKIPEEVRCSKTDEIIRRIEDGKLKLGDDYITTIKTIDYLKQSNANLSATLSSIESSIKAIDGLCDHDSDIQSNRINDTIDNLEKSLKQFDNLSSEPPLVMVHDYSSTPHESRCRPAVSNRPSRPRKRKEYSPRRKKEKDRDEKPNITYHNEHSCEYSSDSQSVERESPKTYTYHSYYSTSPPTTPRAASPVKKLPEPLEAMRPSSFKSVSHDRYLLQRDTQLIKFDKSPSSPIINKSYLESLKPATPIASGRTTRSAENSPPFYQQQPVFPAFSPHLVSVAQHGGALLRHQVGHDGENSHIKSCENLLMRFDYKNISAIAASFPVSSALSPSPTKFRSLDFKHDAALNFSLTSSPNKTLN